MQQEHKMSIEIDIQYNRGDFELVANCTIEDRITGIEGPSASGKSTLIHILAGLLKPDKGRVVIDDHEVFNSERYTFIPPHKRDIGVVFQDGRLFSHLNVRQNLIYGLDRTLAATLDHIIEMLELGHVLEKAVTKLSGGQCQRVALGRALLRKPRLLLLDEPLSALDKGCRDELLPFISRISRSMDSRVIVVSHSHEELLSIAGTILIMRSGRLSCSVSVQDRVFRNRFDQHISA
jgi:molybdate transport system ATP-binding protein